MPGKTKRFTVHASEWANYIVADSRIVKGAKTLSRAYPVENAEAKTFRKVADTRNFDAWTVSNGLKCGVMRDFGKYPCRRPGKGVARAVDDAEMGRVIELELVEPDGKLPVNVDEYTTLVLKEPVPLDGKPLELGMWVKGNSGWGGVYFIVRDAHGRLASNSGLAQYGEMDYSGRTTVCFSGWRYVTADLTRVRTCVPVSAPAVRPETQIASGRLLNSVDLAISSMGLSARYLAASGTIL